MSSKTNQKTRTKKDEIRELAEADLHTFIRLVHPHRVLGNVHIDVLSWWTRQDAKTHQLLLLPRDHQKSALVAYRVAWWITKHPDTRVLYISATANLAQKQLKFIKDIFESDIYRYYWPEMISPDVGKREKWTESEISVDHPKRKAESVRDPTIFTAGLTTTITGLHFDVAVFDDVVVPDNAYTEDGREKVAAQYSQLASIESTDALQWVVGTRYHPKDLYNEMLGMTVEIFDRDGDITDSDELYEIFARQVESQGDGTGEYLWPRQQRKDGKWFGFNQAILARKKTQYLDKTQFWAQYYNDPNSIDDAPVDPSWFQYYDLELVKRKEGHWHYKDRRLNVFASIDFAYTTSKSADYTSIVVVGVDREMNYFILDIDRFKTDKISEYYNRILRMHEKWHFRKLRAEATAAQLVIIRDLKENYIRPYGLALSIEEYRPPQRLGSKEERMHAILQPRYENYQIWHYKGGNIQVLEEELVQRNPQHDDVKDALASCIDACVAPVSSNHKDRSNVVELFNSRFGGVSGNGVFR